MKKLDQRYLNILSMIIRSNGKLDSFTLFKRARVSFSEFTQLTQLLFEKRYLIEKNYEISITDKGRHFCLNAGVNNFPDKEWRKVPDKMLGIKVDISDGYVPSVKLLDKDFFIDRI